MTDNTTDGASFVEQPLTEDEICDPTLTIASSADITALKVFMDGEWFKNLTFKQ